MATDNPALARLMVGYRLRQIRKARGLTLDEAGARLLASQTALSRLESGLRRPSLRNVRDLCALYELDPGETSQLMSLAVLAREAGAGHDDWGRLMRDVEQAASAVTAYAAITIPDLLQAPAYAAAAGAEQETAGALAERQRIIGLDGAPRYEFLLDEAVLHRQIAAPQAMAEQLGWLVTASTRPGVTIRVVPFEAHGPRPADASFTILEFTELPPMAFCEASNDTADAASYREVAGRLGGQAASTDGSLALIATLQEAYRRS